MINKFRNFIIDNKKDLSYLLLLTVFLLIISIPKLLAQYHIGIGNWDTYLYLENGRNFAKMGWGDVPSIAPVLPMILSKMFLIAGHPYQEAIFNIDVVFYIIGVIAFYLLLRLRFEHKRSLVGSVIYATFTLLYSWVAIGGNDIIGVTGTILTVYLILIAHKYNYKFYYIALPIAAFSFLSRYTAGVMLFSIVFFWIISRIDLNELKHIVIGGILGTVSVGWFLYQFYIHLGTPFPFLGQFSGTVSNTVVMDSGFLPDSWYYINHMFNYLMSSVPNTNSFNALVNPMGNIPSIISYVYIVLFILAFILFIYKLISNVKNDERIFGRKKIILSLIIIILLALFVFTLGSVSYVLSNVLFLASLIILWIVLEDYDIDFLDVDLLMISLLVIYLVFQSILFTKNDRYFITVLPFIAYFITYTLDELYNKLDGYNVNLSKILSAVVIVFLLANTLLFVYEIPTDNEYHDIEEACEWLSSNKSINNTTIIYSDNWPAVTWYLNIYCQRGVPDVGDDYYPSNFMYEILHNNDSHHGAIYHIDTRSSEKIDYPGMIKLHRINTVQIYENEFHNNHGYDGFYSKEYDRYLENRLQEFNRTISG